MTNTMFYKFYLTMNFNFVKFASDRIHWETDGGKLDKNNMHMWK